MDMRGIFRPGMRAYFVPLVAGLVLAASAFLPWVIVGTVSIAGVPDVEAMWVAGLGVIAAVLAMLSLITRRNSRHPLLIIGLFALGITFLSWPHHAARRRRARQDDRAGVRDRRRHARWPRQSAAVGIGLYLGMVASLALVAFGLTIVIKRASQPYIVAPADDDV